MEELGRLGLKETWRLGVIRVFVGGRSGNHGNSLHISGTGQRDRRSKLQAKCFNLIRGVAFLGADMKILPLKNGRKPFVIQSTYTEIGGSG